MRSSRLALSMAIAAFAALGVLATPASAAPIALDSVLSAAIGGEYQCRGGYPVPQCEAIEFNRSADRAFPGNGLARTAVAKDTLAGYPAIHAPEFANDGFYGNGSSWISASPNSWVKIDLGRQMRIDRVRIGRDRLGSFNDRDPGRFWIFTATEDDAYANGNGANDATEYTQQFDSQPFNANVTFDWTETLAGRFDPVVARYVKVQLAADGSALDEVEIPSLADTVAPVVTSVDDITRAATGPGGASVTFTKPTASDDVDGSVPVTCNKGSGDTFPLGETTVTCAATDAEGNTGTTTFDVTVEDTTAPAIEPGTDITREATSADGAAVTYTEPTATDAVDGTVPVDCQPASGSTFALGDTTVTCSTTDGAGNTSSTDFKVTVEDTTGPVVQAVDDITREATSADGAAVTYSAPTATDAVDGPVDVTCEPASGGTFPIGTTTITCSAGDAAGNGGSTQFDIKVEDSTAPTLTSIPDFTREATSAAGAAVTFTEPTASDAVDETVSVTCDPASAETFRPGDTTVTCSATDAAGNTGTTHFKVTVVDTTGPAIEPHDDITREATGADGATVSYSEPAANDAVDGSLPVTCTPASDSTFPLGDTTVTCSATDAAGNTGSTTFKVIVEDTTGPAVQAVDDITREATGSNGASVTYGVPTATDAVDGTVGVTCDPSSGSTLPRGDSTVTCSATDAAGNTGTTDFKVTVVDTTGPTLTLPAPVEDATSPSGATVNFATSANDAVDGAVAINCSRASGTAFAIGTTTVSCSAQDAAGNSTTGTFTVLVRAAADQVSDLAARIKAINLKQGIYNAIDTKLQDALAALTEAKQGDKTSTCGKLGAVDNQIQSQAVVKQITQAQADELSAKVRQIRAVIGC